MGAAAAARTGTVYGLTDPRDGKIRYIGATTCPLKVRLQRHLSKAAPRVQAWIDELRAAGLRPGIVPIRENVPTAGLLAAEHDEITHIIAGGGTLLNESSTAEGRKLNERRRKAERAAGERAAWAELAELALDMFGGPMPPGDLPEIEIPAVSWRFMLRIEPGHQDRTRSLISTGRLREGWEERYELYEALRREQQEATQALWDRTCSAWREVRAAADDAFGDRMELHFARAVETPCASRRDASRYLALIVWHMVAVQPWRQLAELGGLPMDDASFIAWAGQDCGTREALTFLAARSENVLSELSAGWYPPHEPGPGHLLAAVTAAYSGRDDLARAVRYELLRVLDHLARDHMLTQPLADLLMRLNPDALNSVFGSDVAAEIDRELSLPAGTSGSVAQALVKRLGGSVGGVERVAARSTQTLPTTAIPDYGTWCGYGVVPARAIGAHLVRAGLAESEWKTREDYLADVRTLWVPAARKRQQAA